MLCKPDQQITAKATVPDNSSDPTDKVYAIVKKDGKSVIRQALNPGGFSNTDWNGDFVVKNPGDYTVTVRAFAKSGKHNDVELKLKVQPKRSEFSATSPNRQLLKDLATYSGGTYYDSVNSFLQRQLPEQKDSGNEKIIHLWNALILLLIISTMLSLEWYIRKKSGLP